MILAQQLGANAQTLHEAIFGEFKDFLLEQDQSNRVECRSNPQVVFSLQVQSANGQGVLVARECRFVVFQVILHQTDTGIGLGEFQTLASLHLGDFGVGSQSLGVISELLENMGNVGPGKDNMRMVLGQELGFQLETLLVVLHGCLEILQFITQISKLVEQCGDRHVLAIGAGLLQF